MNLILAFLAFFLAYSLGYLSNGADFLSVLSVINFVFGVILFGLSFLGD